MKYQIITYEVKYIAHKYVFCLHLKRDIYNTSTSQHFTDVLNTFQLLSCHEGPSSILLLRGKCLGCIQNSQSMREPYKKMSELYKDGRVQIEELVLNLPGVPPTSCNNKYKLYNRICFAS